jgi:hypothetical protein
VRVPKCIMRVKAKTSVPPLHHTTACTALTSHDLGEQ